MNQQNRLYRKSLKIICSENQQENSEYINPKKPISNRDIASPAAPCPFGHPGLLVKRRTAAGSISKHTKGKQAAVYQDVARLPHAKKLGCLNV